MIIGKEKAELNYIPSKIKIESYLYNYSTKKEDIEKRKYWNKKFVKEYLPPIGKYAFDEVFSLYGLPKIDPGRKVKVSPFQLVPIVDLIFLMALIKIITRSLL
jgi:hypothetical protein